MNRWLDKYPAFRSVVGGLSGTQTKHACRFRLYPAPEQAMTLARTFGCVRMVYKGARGLS